VAPRGNNKLTFRFFGPFKVLQRIGKVAYKLDLLAHAQIHPDVHVSQLKKHVSAPAEVSADLFSVCTDPDQELLPNAVLDRIFVPKAGATAARIRVQWGDLPDHMATWEDEADLHRRYPTALA